MLSRQRQRRLGTAMVPELSEPLSDLDTDTGDVRYLPSDREEIGLDSTEPHVTWDGGLDDTQPETTDTDIDLNVEDVEVDMDEVEEEPLVAKHSTLRRSKLERSNTKPGLAYVSRETIMLQPEIKLMQLEKERALNKQSHPDPYQRRADEETALVKRFPWLADRLKNAWEDDKDMKGKGKMNTALNMDGQKRPKQGTGSRFQSAKKPERRNVRDDSSKGEDKVVFSRNVPLLVYNTEKQKCIRVGGDRPNEATSGLEEVYRALHFNPELKKITLDLEDIRFPEKEKTVRLALSYISSNTLHNPFVLNDDFYKYSWRKEVMIKDIVRQIEKRLYRHLKQREERETRLKDIDEAIQQQKEEEELRDRDFVTSNRLLEQSKDIDQEILTKFERRQERKRRIRLRTKSIPIAERAEVKVRQKKSGLPGIPVNSG